MRGFVADILQGIPIWRHKAYLSNPILAAGLDGALGPFHRWCRRFYEHASSTQGKRPRRFTRSLGPRRPTTTCFERLEDNSLFER